MDYTNEFVLTPENYYSEEADKRYMSNSLFKAIYGYPGHPNACEEAALYGPKPESDALLMGSYVDAYFEGADAFEDFQTEHVQQIMLKSGKGKLKPFTDMDAVLDVIKNDSVFMHYAADGNHQTIMTGEIVGQAFKIKMDAYHEDEMIVDVKCVKSAEATYNAYLKKPASFIESYGYYIQGAIYQEIVKQNTGKKLPFIIAYITKESTPDYGLVQLDQDMLDEALTYVKDALLAKPYPLIMKAPSACGRRSCTYCRSKKKITAPMAWEDFVAYSET